MDNDRDLRQRLPPPLLFAGGVALALALALAIFYSMAQPPINDLLVLACVLSVTAAASIAQGHLDARVPVTGQDELAELADMFNKMAAQLETAARQQEALDILRRELVAWVGHDLRTPLTPIRVFVEALSDGIVEDLATVERYLQAAQHHIRSLSRLLDDLFDIAQIEAGGMKLERQSSSIRDLISDTIEAFSRSARRQGVGLGGSTDPAVDRWLWTCQGLSECWLI
jgi:signal transduction histidine kinase